MAEQTERLQKYLAECGVASRRKSEELIAQGRVRVNGTQAKIGDSVRPYKDVITVNGKRVKKEKQLRYLMLHKPRGYVSTMQDEMGRRCVAQLVADVPERVYPVGRLDRNSEGLLFLTNDGSFANAMMHPKHHIAKAYRVTVRPGMTQKQLEKFREGILLDGRMTAPAEISILEEKEDRMVVEIILYEGRNRQIRRMLESMEIEAMRLQRKSVGGVKLGMLPQGKYRELTEQEVRSLMRTAGAAKR